MIKISFLVCCMIALGRITFVQLAGVEWWELTYCGRFNANECGLSVTQAEGVGDVKNGHTCIWDIKNEICRVNDGKYVNCGAHGAFTCGECTVGKDNMDYEEDWCSGDCVWNFQTTTCMKRRTTNKSPNIIFVLADDLGYTDVQYNNASTITPNIKKLAEEGILLNQNYMQSTCAPSRSALMTGMYPIHIGKQDWANLKSIMPIGLPLNRTILPAKLRALGYDTHLVGKWDLGYCHESYTPTRRGFDSFFGFWGTEEDHYTKELYGVKDWKIELDNAEINPNEFSTYPIMDRVKSIIEKRTVDSNPLFLLLTPPLPHDPWEVPQKYYELHPHVKDEDQRTRNAMVTMLDEAIGNLTQMIKDAGIADDTVLIFSSDNGPCTTFQSCQNIIFNLHDRLGQFKGSKADDIFEGGTLVPGFINSPLLPKPFETNALVHVSDWYPTIMRIAGVSSEEVSELFLDGVDQYDMFFNPDSNNGESLRKDMVYNIKTEQNRYVGAVRKGWWKYSQYYQNGKFVRLLYDLENDPTETKNLIKLNKEKRHEMTKFFNEVAEGMVSADSPDACPCAQPACSTVGLPIDCTQCLNADESSFLQTGWCDIEKEIHECISS